MILRKRINLHRNVRNPNRNDPRRLFQVYKPDFMWSPSIPYDQVPNLLSEKSPKPLIFPAGVLEGGRPLVSDGRVYVCGRRGGEEGEISL